MKRVTSFILIFLFISPSAQAAFDNYGSSAKTLSLGNASITITDEPSAVLMNPGALGFLQQKGFQVSLSRLFDLDELSEKELYLVFPFKRFSLGAGFYMFGRRDYYQESLFGLAWAYKIKDRLSFGSSLKYMRVSFSSTYEGLAAFSIDIGSTYKVNDKVQLGFVVKNLNQPELVKNSNDVSTNFCFGLIVSPFSEVNLLFDLSYEERYKEQLHLGQEIRLLKNLPLRFGIQTSPARYSLGFGLNLDRFVLDYAYSNHPVLGHSHKISSSFCWGKSNSD
jgi:hypothetical protein